MGDGKPKEWTPPRMEDEVKVMCSDCNGYLWSEDRYTSGRDSDFAISCPRRRNGKCGYGGR